jgi:hypothetical protein
MKAFLDVHSIISFFLGLLPAGYAAYKLAEFVLRKEIRLFNNLKRTIYLLKTGRNNLVTEKELLSENGLYDVHNSILDLTNDIKPLQTLRDFSVFVVGYSQDYSNYQSILDRVKSKNIPLIVLAKPNEISDEHMNIFQQYIYFEMCNTSARLLTTIFSLSVVTPYEKK